MDNFNIWTIKFKPDGGLYKKCVEDKNKEYTRLDKRRNKKQAKKEVMHDNFEFFRKRNEIGFGWSLPKKK